LERGQRTEFAWEVSWYEEKDKSGLLALNRTEYGDVALACEAYFDWLRTRNPAGEPIIPVAREKGTGKVVGFGLAVPMRISWSGQQRSALIGMNFLVDQAYRRQKICETMHTMQIEEGKKRGYAFIYGFPNAHLLPVLKKKDYRTVTRIPLVIRPLDIATLTKAHINSPFLRWAVNLGWKTGAVTIWREQHPAKSDSSLSIVQDTEFDQSYDHFWKRIKTKYDLILLRDRTFLQWRFRDIPYRTYRVLSVRQGADILGYIVLRQAEIRGTLIGLIVDFLVVPGRQGNGVGLRLLHQATEHFRQAQLPLSGGLMLPHTQEFSIMRWAGYLPSPQRFAPQSFHLATRNLSDSIPSNLLTRAEAWYVSIADHDAA
jgi:predicted N-acetyltransferase YhbS